MPDSSSCYATTRISHRPTLFRTGPNIKGDSSLMLKARASHHHQIPFPKVVQNLTSSYFMAIVSNLFNELMKKKAHSKSVLGNKG